MKKLIERKNMKKKLPDNSNKNPKVLREIKSVSYYENKNRKKDPITEAYKKSSISPKSMFKKSMNELHRLLDKKK